jgi:tetratricopeptide (TPR) repeat protein
MSFLTRALVVGLWTIAFGSKGLARNQTVVIRSDPSGAQLVITEISYQCTTPCDVPFPKEFFDPSGGDWLDSKRLGTSLTAVISMEGYVPQRIELTEGPRTWIAKDRVTFRKTYYFIKNTDFSVRLGRAPNALAHDAPVIAIPQPKSATDYFKGYEKYKQLGQTQQELESLERATELQPNEAEWQYALGNLELKQEGHDGYAQAEHAFERAVTARPGYFEAWVALGSVRVALGDYALAVSAFERAVVLNSSDTDVRILLGKCYGAMGDYPRAITCYRAALSLRPDYAEAKEDLDQAYLELGRSLYKGQRYTDALQALQQVTSNDQSAAAEADFFTGETYRSLEDYEKAQAAYQGVVSLLQATSPTGAEEYDWLGTALYELGDYQKAIGALETAVGSHPDPEDYSKLARALDVVGQYQDALDAAGKAISLRPFDVRAAAVECRAYVGLGKTSEAIITCQQALQWGPGDAECLYYLALAWEQSKNTAKATAAYQASIAQQDSRRLLDGYNYFLRGNAQFNFGEDYATAAVRPSWIRRAIEDYEKAVRLQPYFGTAMFNLGVAYVAEGRAQDAQEEYRILRVKDPERAGKLLKLLENSHAGSKAP